MVTLEPGHRVTDSHGNKMKMDFRSQIFIRIPNCTFRSLSYDTSQKANSLMISMFLMESCSKSPCRRTCPAPLTLWVVSADLPSVSKMQFRWLKLHAVNIALLLLVNSMAISHFLRNNVLQRMLIQNEKWFSAVLITILIWFLNYIATK